MNNNLTLHARGIDYQVEFTFEAAESDTVQVAFDYFSGLYMLKNMKNTKAEKDMTEDEKLEVKKEQLDCLVSNVALSSKVAIDMLYMGLLEHHGINGDITQDIKTREDAKILYKEFAKENPENELSMHSGLFNAMREQMVTDGFFKRIGLEQMMNQSEKKVEPQDHKKKTK